MSVGYTWRTHLSSPRGLTDWASPSLSRAAPSPAPSSSRELYCSLSLSLPFTVEIMFRRILETWSFCQFRLFQQNCFLPPFSRINHSREIAFCRVSHQFTAFRKISLRGSYFRSKPACPLVNKMWTFFQASFAVLRPMSQRSWQTNNIK